MAKPSDYGLWVVAYAHTGQPINAWLKAFDAEAHDGLGYANFTDDFAEALHFRDVGKAMEFWRTRSKSRPLRADGRPNRPLTSFTVEVARLTDARFAALAAESESTGKGTTP